MYISGITQITLYVLRLVFNKRSKEKVLRLQNILTSKRLNVQPYAEHSKFSKTRVFNKSPG